MAQIRQTDKRTGIVYVYETEAKWDPDLKQTRYGKRTLIGHIDPETGEVVPNRPTKARIPSPSSKREFFGQQALLDCVALESGVTDALTRACPDNWKAILSISYYMICESTSVASRFAHWASTHATPAETPLASQRISELFSSISEDMRDRFCACLASIHGAGQRLFYDTTSISSYSEALSCVKWGHNKDHLPVPQLNLALLVGESSGIPLYYRRLTGNIADVSTVETLIAEMEPNFTKKVRLIMDRGFWSKQNINAMMDKHFKFLIGIPASLKLFKDAVDTHGPHLQTWSFYDEDTGLYGMRISHTWDFEKVRPRKGDTIHKSRRSYIYLFFDPTRDSEAKRDLAALLRVCHRELECENRIDAHERFYDEYFERVRGHIVGKDDAIARATSRAGYFALFSNEVMEPFDALSIYRGKDAIEKRFADVKSSLDMRTPRVCTNKALDGKLFVTFVALVLTSWLRCRMEESGLDKDSTLTALLDEVETIERYTQEGHSPRLCEITKKQKAIFEALGYKLTPTS